MKQGDLIYQGGFVLNPLAHSDYQAVLHTEYFDNGDAAHSLKPGYYANQKLTLNSNYNSTVILMTQYLFNPTWLRKLADELERCESEVNKRLLEGTNG